MLAGNLYVTNDPKVAWEKNAGVIQLSDLTEILGKIKFVKVISKYGPILNILQSTYLLSFTAVRPEPIDSDSYAPQNENRSCREKLRYGLVIFLLWVIF